MGLRAVVDRERPLERREQVGDLVGEGVPHFGGGHLFAEALLGERRRELGRRRHAEVASDKQLLKLLERCFVQPAASEDGPDAAGEAV